MIIVDRIITQDDVKKLNEQTSSIVILKNTKGQNALIISQINPNIKIIIIGAYDYNKVERFKQDKYVSRTLYNSTTLAKIIKYYDNLESMLDKNWSDLEKSAYVFFKLLKDINYDYDKSCQLEERNLTSVISGYARCAGFACCFKEAMDRLGIQNEFINIPSLHSYNAINIDGNFRVVDITWAKTCLDTTPNTKEYYKYFGMEIPDSLFAPPMECMAFKKSQIVPLLDKFYKIVYNNNHSITQEK